MISIIVAASTNNVIGVQGELPWKISDDLKRLIPDAEKGRAEALQPKPREIRQAGPAHGRSPRGGKQAPQRAQKASHKATPTS